MKFIYTFMLIQHNYSIMKEKTPIVRDTNNLLYIGGMDILCRYFCRCFASLLLDFVIWQVHRYLLVLLSHFILSAIDLCRWKILYHSNVQYVQGVYKTFLGLSASRETQAQVPIRIFIFYRNLCAIYMVPSFLDVDYFGSVFTYGRH